MEIGNDLLVFFLCSLCPCRGRRVRRRQRRRRVRRVRRRHKLKYFMKTLLTLTFIAIWTLFFISLSENLILWQWISMCLVPVWATAFLTVLLDNKNDLS